MHDSSSKAQEKTKGRIYTKPITDYSAQEVGREGENIAQQYLIKRGYTIRATNLKIAGVEIDIVAQSNQNDTLVNVGEARELVLIEVKTRVCLCKDTEDTYPEYAVDRRKQARYARAAQAFESWVDYSRPIRFDVISIQLMNDNLARIHHSIGAFEVDEQQWQ